jgi:hypothetical protein
LEDEPPEKAKRTRKKKGEVEEKTKQMLTFEAYWRILSGEREVCGAKRHRHSFSLNS